MSHLADKLYAFAVAVHETYTADGLGSTLCGICWFLPTALREAGGPVSFLTGR